jgi:predicted nuclease with TOPRIM domain
MNALTSIEQIDTPYLRKLQGEFENAFTPAGVIIKHGVNVELSARIGQDPEGIIEELRQDVADLQDENKILDKECDRLRGEIDDQKEEIEELEDRLREERDEHREKVRKLEAQLRVFDDL